MQLKICAPTEVLQRCLLSVITSPGLRRGREDRIVEARYGH
jgi:hypothetical protein